MIRCAAFCNITSAPVLSRRRRGRPPKFHLGRQREWVYSTYLPRWGPSNKWHRWRCGGFVVDGHCFSLFLRGWLTSIDVNIYEGENLIFYLIWEDYPSRSVNRESPIILRVVDRTTTHLHLPLHSPQQHGKWVHNILARKIVFSGSISMPDWMSGWMGGWMGCWVSPYPHIAEEKSHWRWQLNSGLPRFTHSLTHSFNRKHTGNYVPIRAIKPV